MRKPFIGGRPCGFRETGCDPKALTLAHGEASARDPPHHTAREELVGDLIIFEPLFQNTWPILHSSRSFFWASVAEQSLFKLVESPCKPHLWCQPGSPSLREKWLSRRSRGWLPERRSSGMFLASPFTNPMHISLSERKGL